MLEQVDDLLISATRLSKRFGDVAALSDLDIELRAGDLVGLLGRNGAGKTTTLKLLLGLLRPTSGRASVLGLDCTRDSERVKALVGFTPDEPRFYDVLSGRETLDFVIGVRGLSSRAAWEGLGEMIEILEFAPQLDRLTAAYSHGTKKKLALLCALVHRPRVLLLDEPTNGLDPEAASRVRALLRKHADAGGVAIVSTHLLDMAEQLGCRLLVLDRGRKVAEGSPADLREQAMLGGQASTEEAFLRLVGT